MTEAPPAAPLMVAPVRRERPALSITAAFLTTVAALILCVIVQIAAVRALIGMPRLWATPGPDGTPDGADLMEIGASLPGLIAAVVPMQLTLVAVAAGVARLSPLGVVRRLGLTTGRLPLWTWVPLIAAAPTLTVLCQLALGPIASGEETKFLEQIEAICARSSGWGLIALAVVLSVAPGLGEEMLFRGYLQTRLMRHWPVSVAVLLVGVLFACAHLDPIHVLLVIPMGVYLSLVRWKTDSVWPCVLAHAYHNFVMVVFAALTAGLQDATLAEQLTSPSLYGYLLVLGIGGLLGFVAAGIFVWPFCRTEPPTTMSSDPAATLLAEPLPPGERICPPPAVLKNHDER